MYIMMKRTVFLKFIGIISYTNSGNLLRGNLALKQGKSSYLAVFI